MSLSERKLSSETNMRKAVFTVGNQVIDFGRIRHEVMPYNLFFRILVIFESEMLDFFDIRPDVNV